MDRFLSRLTISVIILPCSAVLGYHPIQEQIAQHYGSQCGYCTPGFVMNMYRCVQGNGIFGIFAYHLINVRKMCSIFLYSQVYIFHNDIFTVAIVCTYVAFGILFIQLIQRSM